jgi:hypothetical protein
MTVVVAALVAVLEICLDLKQSRDCNVTWLQDLRLNGYFVRSKR